MESDEMEGVVVDRTIDGINGCVEMLKRDGEIIGHFLTVVHSHEA